MTGFDIIVLLIVAIAAIGGFMRGFVQEVLSLASWVLAVFAIRFLHTDLTAFLYDFIGTPSGAAVLAFVLLFLPTFLFVKLLARSIGKKSRSSVLGPVDRVLGGGFGLLKGLLAATLFFLLSNLATDLVYGPDAERPEWMRASRTYPLLNASGRAIVDWVEARRHGGYEA